ncbi:MAG: BatD family protein [Myxococcota bacterium]
MSGSAAALGLAALVLSSAPRARASEELSAEVTLRPEDPVLHQQVVMRVRVVHPVWARPSWEPPAFEGFWSERLSSRGAPLEHDASGNAVRATLYRRALFPSRTGRLEIPASRVRYRDREQQLHEIPVPGASLDVSPLPEASRPEGFGQLVGSPRISTYLSATEVGLGRNLRLVLDYHGSANLWAAPAPDLEAAFGRAVEVFREPPTLVFGESRGDLTVRRTLHYDLVPRKLGDFEVPALALVYFDPAAHRYASVRSKPIPFHVVRVRSHGRTFPGRPASRTRAPPLPWAPLALLALAIAAVVSLSLSRWWRSASAPRSPSSLPSPRVAYQVACEALGSRSFAARLSEAVKAGIHARYHFDAAALTTEEIERRISDDDVLSLLRALDHTRFTGRADNAEALLHRARSWLRL